MDSKAIWLAVGFAFDSGLRQDNLTLKNGPPAEDHCIRAGHAVLTIVDPTSGVESRIKAGPLIERFLRILNNKVDTKTKRRKDIIREEIKIFELTSRRVFHGEVGG
jgi:hypothetical protein